MNVISANEWKMEKSHECQIKALAVCEWRGHTLDIEIPRNFSYVCVCVCANLLTTYDLFQKFKPFSFIYACIVLGAGTIKDFICERIGSSSSVLCTIYRALNNQIQKVTIDENICICKQAVNAPIVYH